MDLGYRFSSPKKQSVVDGPILAQIVGKREEKACLYSSVKVVEERRRQDKKGATQILRVYRDDRFIGGQKGGGVGLDEIFQ